MTRTAWLILLFALSIGATLYWGDYRPGPIKLSGADLTYWAATHERTEKVVTPPKERRPHTPSPKPENEPDQILLANCDTITQEAIERIVKELGMNDTFKYAVDSIWYKMAGCAEGCDERMRDNNCDSCKTFACLQGDVSYWVEQQMPVWHFKLILTTQKTILDLKLDSLRDVAKRYENLNPQGILMIEVQRWLANQDLQDLIATVSEPCLCDSKAEATGGTVFRQYAESGKKIFSVKEGHVNQALSLAQAASLNRASLANEYDLFDAAEALELRCVPAHNLHLAYLRGDGDYILKEEKTEASRLARLIAMKAVMLAAETQAVTLADVGELTYAAQQVMQRSEAIKAYSGCR